MIYFSDDRSRNNEGECSVSPGLGPWASFLEPSQRGLVGQRRGKAVNPPPPNGCRAREARYSRLLVYALRGLAHSPLASHPALYLTAIYLTIGDGRVPAIVRATYAIPVPRFLQSDTICAFSTSLPPNRSSAKVPANSVPMNSAEFPFGRIQPQTSICPSSC